MSLEDRLGELLRFYQTDLDDLYDSLHDLAREVYEEGFGRGYAAAVAEENFDEALEREWNEYS